MLQTLKANPGRNKAKRRVGRGNGSGAGTYSGRGMKGQSARSGGKRKSGFEGGQMSYIKRMPKLKGFKNPNRVEFQVVNVGDLNDFNNNDEVNIVSLYEKNLICKKDRPVKILGKGELTKKLNIKADRVSSSAQEKITKAGGKFEELLKIKETSPKKAKEKPAEVEPKEEAEASTNEE